MVESKPTAETRGQIGVEITDLGMRVHVAVALAATGAPTLRSAAFPQPPEPEMLVERVSALVAAGAATQGIQPTGVGVAVWGRARATRGELDDPRFGAAWAGVNLAARLSDALGVPVRLATGVQAAAQAEALVGAGVGRSPLLYVHLGRTVTSALVVNSESLTGAHDDEGRLGHWQTGLDGPRCVCGATGHLEPLVSAQSLIRLAIGAAADDDEALAAIHRVTGRRAEALTIPQLVRLAQQEPGPLRELLLYATDALASALANLKLTLDPAVTLIGGPFAQADDVFFVWLRERVTARLAGVGSIDAAEIGPASIAAHGAAIGALLLAPR